jgi:protein-disulfide isomerase
MAAPSSGIETSDRQGVPKMRVLRFWLLLMTLSSAAQADDGFYPLMADDGTTIANHRVDVSIEAEIEKLPGVVIAGNPRGTVTLAEFYDVNCPYCRKASADIDRLLKTNHELRLILVPFPVLGVGSIQGTRAELAVARLGGPKKFYEFHRRLDQVRGPVDGARALAVAQQIGLDPAQVLKVADGDDLAEIMKAHVKLGDDLAIQATPGFVIQGVAIVGYPGAKALAKIIDAVDRCGAVICNQDGAAGKP